MGSSARRSPVRSKSRSVGIFRPPRSPLSVGRSRLRLESGRGTHPRSGSSTYTETDSTGPSRSDGTHSRVMPQHTMETRTLTRVSCGAQGGTGRACARTALARQRGCEPPAMNVRPTAGFPNSAVGSTEAVSKRSGIARDEAASGMGAGASVGPSRPRPCGELQARFVYPDVGPAACSGRRCSMPGGYCGAVRRAQRRPTRATRRPRPDAC